MHSSKYVEREVLAAEPACSNRYSTSSEDMSRHSCKNLITTTSDFRKFGRDGFQEPKIMLFVDGTLASLTCEYSWCRPRYPLNNIHTGLLALCSATADVALLTLDTIGGQRLFS